MKQDSPAAPPEASASRSDAGQSRSSGIGEPVAIVGMACRFPGAESLDAFWRLLDSGGNAITEGEPGSGNGRLGELFPDDAVRKPACRFGGFVDDIDLFDASFFRISPAEAQFLDPQQRMMLETSWEALEDAGIDPDRLKGSLTGVYTGISNDEYRMLVVEASKPAEAATCLYALSGTNLNGTSGRVAFVLGLMGPAKAVDAACASALVSLHDAVADLQQRKADLAIAGGVQAMLSGRIYELRAEAMMLSPDGQCKAFDASANGYVRSEGCGVVVLKRLSDAEADGDRIWAVIRGVAVNHGGASAGLTVPNAPALEQVMEAALAQAGVSPSEVDYLEAHGTGTAVGDPIEIDAAAGVYGRGREPDHPLLVGSVKTNVGHLEAAAGVAGLIKAVLALHRGVIPQHLHFETPNPEIEWDRVPLRVTTAKMDWPFRPGRPRRAGVNCFGISGTNSHAVVEAYDPPDAAPGDGAWPAGAAREVAAAVPAALPGPALPDGGLARRQMRLLPLSGKSAGALREQAQRYLSWLDERGGSLSAAGNASDPLLSDMAWTAATGRSHFGCRAGVAFHDASSLRAQLAAVAESAEDTQPGTAARVAFAYTGQGSQWVGMGQALYDCEPVARTILDRCEAVFRQERQASLLDVMFGRPGGEGDLGETAWEQPALYALQCALTALWRSLGVRPAAAIGHSVGELAAAEAAGVFGLEDGMRFAAARGALLSDTDPGAMLAVFAPAARTAELVEAANLSSGGVGLCVSADNGTHRVVSGPVEDIEAMAGVLEAEGIRARRLNTKRAFHSALLDPVLDRLEASLDGIALAPPSLTLVSNLTGRAVEPGEPMDGAYWRRHAREAVAFADGVGTLAGLAIDLVLEIGPRAVLAPMTVSAWPEAAAAPAPVALPSLHPPSESGGGSFTEAVARAYEAGLPLALEGLFAGEARRRIALPSYPFQRERHWLDGPKRLRREAGDPLLGVRHESANGEIAFETELFPSDPAWLDDHKVYRRVIAPGALYAAMAASASLAERAGPVVLEDMQLHSPLIFPEADPEEGSGAAGRTMQVLLSASEGEKARRVRVFSKADDGNWAVHIEGRIPGDPSPPETAGRIDPDSLKAALEPVDVAAYYRARAGTGIDLGPAFRTLAGIWARPGEALGEVSLPDAARPNGLDIHPLVLDGCFQVVGAARSLTGVQGSTTYLPFGCERLWLSGPLPDRVLCHARMRDASLEAGSADDEAPEVLSGELGIYDMDGSLLGGLSGYTVKRATRAALLSADQELEDLLYEIAWQSSALAPRMRSADFLADPAKALSCAGPLTSYLAAEGVEARDRSALLADLEQLSRRYALAALEDLGWDRVAGAAADPGKLRQRLQVEPRHERLFLRLLEMLAGAGILKTAGDGFVVALGSDDPLPGEMPEDARAFADRMRERHAHGAVEIGFLQRCAESLADVLLGRADPVALLFSGEPSAADMYSKSAVARAGNRMLADVIGGLAPGLPAGRPLRVLEIGAGTGSATAAVLPELPDGGRDYTFTDISAGFFAEAESRFGGRDAAIEYRVLDVERDPATQGFEAHGYDLIIASNVLHATRRLDETLAHCRALLAPAGLLVALERLMHQSWLDLTFGLLEGWWRFADAYRPRSPLAEPAVWRRALADAGFGEAAVSIADESDAQAEADRGVIVARGPAEAAEAPGLWVVTGCGADAAAKLARELAAHDQTVVLAGGDAAPAKSGHAAFHAFVEAERRESWKSLLEDLPGGAPLQGIVHLAALDAHGPEAATEQVAEDVKRAVASALAMVQGVADSGIAPARGLWLVTRGAQVLERERDGRLAGAALWGFGKAVAREAPELRLRMIDLDPQENAVPPALTDELLSPDRENHIAYRDGRRNVARLVRMEEETDRISLPDGEGWLLAPDAGGSLDGIRKRPLPARPLEPREVRVAVEAAGADFKDVLSGLGLIDTGLLGGEFCGRVLETGSDVTRMAAGDPVLGLAFGTFRSEVVTREEMVVAAPPGFPVVELATMPTVFVSAALSFDLAALGAGDRVLVHAGSGGVGLAAIQLAQAAGAKVFATASARKQAFLRSLGVEHVYDSRTTAFGREILEDTGGAGVDVVLNSLTGEGFIEASLSCLATGGRFVELARLNILSEEEMSAARPDVAYSVLQVDVLKETDQALIGDTLGRVMKRLAAGELKPLVRNRWPMAETRSALKFMQAARHVGKIVLTAPQLANGRLRGDRTYLVTGGLGGIGCAVAGWLADRGAGTIVLNGRRAPDPAAEKTIRSLEERGVDVAVKIADMADTAAVDAMLASMDRDLPPLGGVIHSVGVLSDGALTNQSWERFEQVLWPKIKGAWHLHRATADRDLDLFILFSSRVGVIGNPGQSNHAAANAFLDQLAAHRRALGLPGQAIAWGAWSEIGEAAEQRDRIETQRAALGGRWFTPQLGLAAFDRLVRRDIATSVVMSMDWSVFEAAVGERPPLVEDLLSAEADAEAEADAPHVADDLLSRLRRAAEAESGDLLLPFVQREVQAVLRLSAPPPPSAKFFDLGMDSLMAVELRNRLNRAFAGEYVAPNTVVFDYPDAARLAGHLAEALGEREAPDSAESPGRPEPRPPEAPPQRSADQGGIAVVGMACRFPGAPDLAAYWDRLATGADAITDGRPGSGDWRDAVGDPGAEDPAFRRGGFVRDLDGFDARFFRIRPIEARTMDPQQRMLLETSWHALEDAGMDPGGLRGSRTGVYAGLSGCEYRDLINDRNVDSGYLGTAGAVAAGRIAFVLGLMGPAMPIDMTCASSLAALHEAAGALKRGEVDLALAGGVNAILSPARTRFMLELGMLSRTGQCRTFDASADGHVRGEGCGMVVLKRLKEAEADGDRIWGVIRGSAVNHNGTGGGLTLPNGLAQQQVIEEALSRAGVAPAEVDYLEAHGTGSALGDTIELQAVSAAYGRGRDAGRPLLVGTAKTNLGHLEAAAGIAGVIKVVLAMRHGTIPRHLHFDTPNPHLDWDRLPIRVTSEPIAWPADAGRPARAGVSAFAISGSNAHMIVEGYSAPDGRPAPEGPPNRVAVVLPEAVVGDAPDGKGPGPRRVRVLPLSGNSDSALRTLAERYLSWLDERADELAAGDAATAGLLSDMAWTAGTGRSHLAHRSGVVFHDLASLRKGLNALVQADKATEPREAPKIAFAYPGQDGPWAGIGEALHRSEPVARAVLDRCDAVIRDERGASLLDRMFGRDGSPQDLRDPEWAFPAIHALECTLAALWASVGIRPSVVVGSGAGDLAAAHAAGVFGLDQALRLAAALGARDGTAAELPADPAAGPPLLPFVSGRTGREMAPDEAGDRAYWLDRVHEPAAHGPCARTLSEHGIEGIVEVGPDPSLGPAIAGSWPAGSGGARRPLVLSSLRPSSGRGTEAVDAAGFPEAVAGAYEAGLPVAFAGLFAGEKRRRISLPGYPFERRRYWIRKRSDGKADHARNS